MGHYKTTPSDSKHNKGLQFADLMAGAIGATYEFKKSHYLDAFYGKVRITELFFQYVR